MVVRDRPNARQMRCSEYPCPVLTWLAITARQLDLQRIERAINLIKSQQIFLPAQSLNRSLAAVVSNDRRAE
jgi:hypothetical protein